MGTAELSTMEPLTAAERTTVELAMPLMPRTLGQARFAGFVQALGAERCYDAATSAYMRAAKCWNPALSPFPIYANLWVRKFLIAALTEAAAAGDVSLPELTCTLPMPDETAERIELIDAAFRVLPARQREVLSLRSAGLTWPEVADAMGCCLNLVRRYHVRAMGRIWRLAPQLRGSSHG